MLFFIILKDWLEYFDGKRVWSRLRRECDFILHGHGHEPKVTAEHGTGGDCVIIPAGASFERRVAKDPSHINSYNFVHLDLETGKGTVFLRRWIDERTEWARDDQTYPDGKFSFDLPGASDDRVRLYRLQYLIRSDHLPGTLRAASGRLRPFCMAFEGRSCHRRSCGAWVGWARPPWPSSWRRSWLAVTLMARSCVDMKGTDKKSTDNG